MRKNLIIFLIITILLISGCKKTEETQTPTVPPEAVNTEPASDIEPLYMGYIPGGTMSFMIERWEKMADYLSGKTGIPVEAKSVKSYKDFVKDFKAGEIDIGYFGGVMYVKLNEEMGLIPLVTPVEKGKTSYKGYIIVKEDSGISTLEDLKGKSFSFVNKHSTSGYLMPRLMMLEEGIENTEKYFSKVEYTEDHLSCLISVYNGYSDGGAISEFVFDTEEASKYEGIKVIMETEEVPSICIAVRKDMKPEYIEKLKNAFLEIGKTPETKELMELFETQGYLEAKDSDYDMIKKAMDKISKYEDIDIFENEDE